MPKPTRPGNRPSSKQSPPAYAGGFLFYKIVVLCRWKHITILARFFIGEPYEEEVLPAEVINFFGVGTVVFVLVVLTVVVYLTSLLL